MWREYSAGYLKGHKAAGITIAAAALIASFFLSLVSGIFYNMWQDDIRRIIREQGDWQGKLTGDIGAAEAEVIKSFANVQRVVCAQEEGQAAAYVYFENPRRIYEQLPLIAEKLGVEESSIEYHNWLLTRYFIYSPQEKKDPPLLLAVYLCILAAAGFSLVMIIHNAFAVTMNERVHELGILKSVGAAPRQIGTFLMQEAVVLCLPSILLGIPLGMGGTWLFIRMADRIASGLELEGEVGAVFSWSWQITAIAFAACLLTVAISAWLPAHRLARMSTLEAVKCSGQPQPNKGKRFTMLSVLCGAEGELAEKSLYARKRAYRTSSLSLMTAFLVFSFFSIFETVSYISTYHTYFERYKDIWDLRVTLKDGGEDGDLLSAVRQTDGVSSCISYRLAEGWVRVGREDISKQLQELSGPDGLADSGIGKDGDGWLVKAPLLVLDDESFDGYCESAGIGRDAMQEDAAVLVNRVWDTVNSDHNGRIYIPFLKEQTGKEFPLFTSEKAAAAELKVFAYTDRLPALREEYGHFSLVQIMREETYRKLESAFPAESRIFQVKAVSEEKIGAVQSEIEALLDGRASYDLENRQDEERFNEEARKGYRMIVGILSVILALIGIANVFSNLLGGIAERRREFARYVSVGLEPSGVKRMIWMEGMLVAVRPLVCSLLLDIPVTALLMRAGGVTMKEFLPLFPILPLLLFTAFVLAAAALACYLGEKKIRSGDLGQILKEETAG